MLLDLLTVLGVLWENPDPATVALPCLFESDNLHLLSGAAELLLGEPVRRTSFFDEGCRCGSVRENVLYEGLLTGVPARLFDWLFDRRRPHLIQSFK